MAPKSVELPRFGALELHTDPQDVSLGAAIDALNVDLNIRGILRSRDGYTKWNSVAAVSRLGKLFSSYEPSGTMTRLFAAQPGTTKLIAYDTAGTALNTSNTLISNVESMVQYGGSGGTSVMYGGSGDVSGRLLKYVPSVFSYPIVGHSGVFVAVQPGDNRLALGYTSASAHRVQFSDAGAPETFTANNYVDLWPNDGSFLRGLFSWNNLLFAFKETRYAVFYGNSVDGSGNPVFNYRAVDVGIGMHGLAACTSPHGVYFLSQDGIYLTTGGPPVKVSKALDPLFDGTLPGTYGGSGVNLETATTTAQMAWLNGRLYFAAPTGSSTSNDRVFVLDPDIGWLVWNIPAAGLTSWFGTAPSSRVKNIYFSYASGTNDVGVIAPTATSDAGVAIAANYRTGFWNPGAEGSEAWVREILLDGVGAVTVKTAVNDTATLGSGQAVTLGTSPAVAQGRDRRGVRGRNVSYEFSGTAPWSLSRVTPLVWGQSALGAKSS